MAPDNVQFGAPVGQYRAGVLRVVTLLTGILSLAASLFLGWIILQGITKPELHQKNPQAGVVGIVGLFGAAIYCFWQWYAWRGTRADLFERGMILSGGGKTRAIAWNEIALVAPAANQYSNNVYRIELFNGETVFISWAFGRVFHLGDTIQRMLAATILPRAISAWQGGAAVPFGPIHVLPAGLLDNIRHQTLPWNDVGAVKLGAIYATITRKEGTRWAAFSKYGVPNAYVLIGLVEHILAAKP
ncbi:MAG TPA: DUF6585 family protein [Ktedonobacterales bacterium]